MDNSKENARLRRYYRTARGYRYRVRNNAMRRGISFDISLRDFTEWFETNNKTCHYCGQLLVVGGGGRAQNTFTIDRRDNNIGYRLDNIVGACYWCNQAKGNIFSADEWLQIAQGVKFIREKQPR